MATPNLANINTYFTSTKVVNVSTTLSNVVTNIPFSNSLIKVNSLIVSNESAATTTNVNVMLVSNGIQTNLATKLLMPPGNVITLFNKTNEFNILENSALRANAENNSVIEMVVTYEAFSEKLPPIYLSETYPLDILLIAGGGGGNGGGGGGGGFFPVNFANVNKGIYSVVVGAGGSSGAQGSNTYISRLNSNIFVSIGGGAGGAHGDAMGGNGGSGGGGGGSRDGFGTGRGGLNFPLQGCIGSNGLNNSLAAGSDGGVPGYNAGGGGGGGEAANGQKGGNGCLVGFNGVLSYFAGGGGGGGSIYGGGATGGCGGGGCGSAGNGGTPAPAPCAIAGSTNTGGGGGGVGLFTGSTVGAAGGSGILFVRHPTERPCLCVSNVVGGTCLTTPGWCTFRFTGSGSFTIN